MKLPRVASVAAFIALLAVSSTAAAQGTILSGTWVINTTVSQFPKEIGFGMDLLPPGASNPSDPEFSGGGSGTPLFAPSRSSEDDARKTRLLVSEVRRPPNWFKVVQDASVISILDDRGRTRTFRPNGRDDAISVDGTPVSVVSRWEGTSLVIRYRVASGRELRYTLTKKPDGSQLQVEVRFIERGGNTVVTRIYEPAVPGAPLPAPSAPPVPAQAIAPRGVPAGPGGVPPGPGGVPPGAGAAPPRDVPASGHPGDVPLGPQKQDAELKGITRLGVVIEDLTSQAAACGLERSTLETTIATSLTDAGFKIQRNADEDTYLYIDIITASVSNGVCVSRYDASLYTHATTRLDYQDQTVLVRVLLLHEGGLAGGNPKEHSERVLANLTQHVKKFGERIRAAGQ